MCGLCIYVESGVYLPCEGLLKIRRFGNAKNSAKNGFPDISIAVKFLRRENFLDG